jgi:hypothetical protein
MIESSSSKDANYTCVRWRDKLKTNVDLQALIMLNVHMYVGCALSCRYIPMHTSLSVLGYTFVHKPYMYLFLLHVHGYVCSSICHHSYVFFFNFVTEASATTLQT